MKSIIESVAEWLRENPYLSVEPTTDALRCGVEAAGLFKAPESVREYSVDGSFSAVEHYLFTLRRESLTEQDRQESERLLEETCALDRPSGARGPSAGALGRANVLGDQRGRHVLHAERDRHGPDLGNVAGRELRRQIDGGMKIW